MDVWSFLRHVGFYRHFTKDFSKVVKPLCNLHKSDVPFDFNKKCLQAFSLTKEKLILAPIVIIPH